MSPAITQAMVAVSVTTVVVTWIKVIIIIILQIILNTHIGLAVGTCDRHGVHSKDRLLPDDHHVLSLRAGDRGLVSRADSLARQRGIKSSASNKNFS